MREQLFQFLSSFFGVELIFVILCKILITACHYPASVGELDASVALDSPITKFAVLSQIVNQNIFLKLASASHFDEHFESAAMLFFEFFNHFAVILVEEQEASRTVILFTLALEEVLALSLNFRATAVHANHTTRHNTLIMFYLCLRSITLPA